MMFKTKTEAEKWAGQRRQGFIKAQQTIEKELVC